MRKNASPLTSKGKPIDELNVNCLTVNVSKPLDSPVACVSVHQFVPLALPIYKASMKREVQGQTSYSEKSNFSF